MALDKLTRQNFVQYIATGVGDFGIEGSPEGVEAGGMGSRCTDLLTGDLYVKTTAFDDNTGWVLLGGGGGSGTVTSFSAGNLSPLFTSNVATATTTPALTFAQVSQLQNLFFASPNGSSGNPVFRAILAADIPSLPFSGITGIVPLSQGGTGQDFSGIVSGEIIIGSGAGTVTKTGLVAGITNSIQINNGGGLLDGSDEALIDLLTATLQLGKATANSGQIQLFGTTANHFFLRAPDNGVVQRWVLPAALPADNTRFLKVGSVGATDVQLEYAVPSGGASVADPTGTIGLSAVNGVAATALRSDGAPALDQGIAPTWTANHIWSGASANRVAVGLNGNTNPVLRVNTNIASQATGIEIIGRAAAAGVDISVISSGANENLSIYGKGTGQCNVGSLNQNVLFTAPSYGFPSGKINNSGFVLRSGGYYGWSNNLSSADTSPDTALVKAVAGVVRATNGSTGIGSLLVAQNGVTAQGNLHVEPTATGTRPIYTNSPSGATANLIQCQNNTSDRFVVSPTGKITNNQNGVASVRTCGQYVADVSDYNNSGTGQTDLFSNTLPANLLGTNLDCLTASFSGIFAANANNKQVKVLFDGNTIFDTGALAFNNTDWDIETKIYRVSASVQRCVTTWKCSDVLLGVFVAYADTGSDLTTNLILKVAGTGGATNDITQKTALIVINPN